MTNVHTLVFYFLQLTVDHHALQRHPRRMTTLSCDCASHARDIALYEELYSVWLQDQLAQDTASNRRGRTKKGGPTTYRRGLLMSITQQSALRNLKEDTSPDTAFTHPPWKHKPIFVDLEANLPRFGARLLFM